MKDWISKIKAKLKEKPYYVILFCIGILVMGLGFLFGPRLFKPDVMSKQLDTILPPFGWNVVEDLGIGEVPGGPTAQQFALRQDDGWEVLAYCLNPEEAPPRIGTSCELVDEDTFWCGDDYQQLREFEILQQPPPPEQTETPTPTLTLTPTVTVTMTQTPTTVITSTNTPVPTQRFTPTPRPKMGGGGNFRVGDAISITLGLLMIVIGVSIAAIDWKGYTAKFKKK